ncbi:MAG: hypothetical protein ACI840_001887, partial [Ulvibacter sp.]
NKDTVDDRVIFNHLYELSDGKIDYKDSTDELVDATELLKTKKRFVSNSGPSSSSSNKKNYKSSSNNRNSNRKRY